MAGSAPSQRKNNAHGTAKLHQTDAARKKFDLTFIELSATIRFSQHSSQHGLGKEADRTFTRDEREVENIVLCCGSILSTVTDVAQCLVTVRAVTPSSSLRAAQTLVARSSESLN